ncbi:MAG: SUMF1/EgtB/PvdO family nonheme iron enzyme [Candidatus Tectimicrobiota bacterium]
MPEHAGGPPQDEKSPQQSALPQLPSTAPLEARDITAHTVNTGIIEQHTHLHLTVMTEHLEHLAASLAQPGAVLRPAANGGLDVVTETQAAWCVPGNLLEAWRLLPRAIDATLELRQRAYAAWLLTRQPAAPPQEVAARERYVPLAGWLRFDDLHLMLRFTEQRWRGEGPQRQLERRPLAHVSEAMAEHAALVLLGPPGCGKSTVLRHLALEAARAVLSGQSRRLPLRVHLADYDWPALTPLAFLAQCWQAEGLPGTLLEQVRSEGVLLLADGLNEMARLPESEAQRRANDWQRCLEEHFQDPRQPSRVVLASRDQADYAQPLGLPRVEIEPLSPEQIDAFLRAYLDTEAAAALAAIRHLDLLEHARNPYQLSILAALSAHAEAPLPTNRGRLFADYAHWLLQREAHANHPHWLSLDLQRAALSHLGYAMQELSESTLLSHERVLRLLPASLPGPQGPLTFVPEHVLELACHAGVLLAEPPAGAAAAYRFSHQLLQEQFAAQHLLTLWQAGQADARRWWGSPRAQADMPAPPGGAWDPLPPPPPTGWEQTTILAAGMTAQPDALVRAVLACAPALAGRCLHEGGAAVSADTRQAVQQALLADLGDATLHRRVRLAAGRALGVLGDPRLLPQDIDGITVIVPELVPVPAGTATLGSARWPWERQAYAHERPRHQVPVASFFLARFPVTNAEYACFMQAGGYATARYWTPQGWQWRQGQGDYSGPVEEFLARRQYYVQHPREIDRRLRDGRMTPDNAAAWRQLITLSADEARQRCIAIYPVQAHEQPRYWLDPAYNAPNQPVVGVTWYEAMAYAAWLQERLALSRQLCPAAALSWHSLLHSGAWQVRLPSEVEWEWAAGGPEHQRYPWGSRFSPEQANTLEGRVLGTTPVGAYPAGRAACGALDMSGNVWEWTCSLYRPYPSTASLDLKDLNAEGQRVLRGGAWSSDASFARVSSRTHWHPDFWLATVGLRLVVAPVFS